MLSQFRPLLFSLSLFSALPTSVTAISSLTSLFLSLSSFPSPPLSSPLPPVLVLSMAPSQAMLDTKAIAIGCILAITDTVMRVAATDKPSTLAHVWGDHMQTEPVALSHTSLAVRE